jgi:1-acyl-sn-glycerol-3-phosphate acyltransferase
MPRYFTQPDPNLVDPGSLTSGQAKPGENPYLSMAHVGAVNAIAFSDFLKAYEPLLHIATVQQFSRQVTAFRSLIQEGERTGVAGRQLKSGSDDSRVAMSCGHCMATIAYAQLIAENAQRLGVPAPMISAIFHLLVIDLSAAGQELAALPELDMRCRRLARRLVAIPKSIDSDWSFVADRVSALSRQVSATQVVVGKGEPDTCIPESGRSISGDGALSPDAGRPTPFAAPEASFLWECLRIPTRILGWLLFDLKVYGRQHIPKTGGVLIICNHQSNLDPVLVAVRLDRPLNYIAKSQLFHRRFARWLLRSLNAFPVRQGKGDVGAVRETIRRLQQGHVVNMYPEGQRTPDGRIQPLQKGISLIIKRANVPIVPAAIIGTYEAWPIHRRFLRPSPVRIRFGAPLDLASLQSEDEIIAAIDHELHRMFEQMQRRFAPPTVQPVEPLPAFAPAE